MENNQIYAQMRRKIKFAYQQGRDETIILIYKPIRYHRKGMFGALVDRLFGLKIDIIPDDENCRTAINKLVHDGFNIDFYRVGNPDAPYCKAVVCGISLLNQSRL